MGNTITAFAYDASAGALAQIETVPTLPDDYDEVSHTADIHITADGKYLYGSNRGHDSLAMYAVDGVTGRLSLLGIVPTGGENPRNFGIDPTNSFVLVGNQSSDTVTYHRLDPGHGPTSSLGRRSRYTHGGVPEDDPGGLSGSAPSPW